MACGRRPVLRRAVCVGAPGRRAGPPPRVPGRPRPDGHRRDHAEGPPHPVLRHVRSDPPRQAEQPACLAGLAEPGGGDAAEGGGAGQQVGIGDGGPCERVDRLQRAAELDLGAQPHGRAPPCDHGSVRHGVEVARRVGRRRVGRRRVGGRRFGVALPAGCTRSVPSFQRTSRSGVDTHASPACSSRPGRAACQGGRGGREVIEQIASHHERAAAEAHQRRVGRRLPGHRSWVHHACSSRPRGVAPHRNRPAQRRSSRSGDRSSRATPAPPRPRDRAARRGDHAHGGSRPVALRRGRAARTAGPAPGGPRPPGPLRRCRRSIQRRRRRPRHRRRSVPGRWRWRVRPRRHGRGPRPPR